MVTDDMNRYNIISTFNYVFHLIITKSFYIVKQHYDYHARET